MALRIHLEVVTPERKVLEADVDRVEVPGLDGELGILPGHTELISQLKPAGLLTYHTGDTKGEMSISDGFVEVSPDRVVVLADRAEKPEEIDLPRALELKEHAERQLQKAMSDPDIDVVRATADLERASINLKLAERFKR
jgi:F-type H+-transporting ATPase subunit epsilon